MKNLSLSLPLVRALALCGGLWAQDTRGKISGTVTDAQGATVANASIAITNLGAGLTTSLRTGASGYYEAPLLLPGKYSVTVEMAGFKRLVRSGLNLGLGEQLLIDGHLEVGGTTESVTVTAEASILDTNSVTTGWAITHREVMDLPV